MKFNTKTTAVCGLLATFALTSLTPVLASPASRQSNKNQWRNLGIAGAVIAGYGLLEHNQTATLLGAAGAAYSANRYEQDRHSQSQNNDWRQRYYRNYNNNGNYSNGRTYGWNANDQNGNSQSYNTQNDNGYQYRQNDNQYGNRDGAYNDDSQNTGRDYHDRDRE